MTCCACIDSSTQQDKPVEDKKTVGNYLSNLVFVDQKYQIDTIAILNNNNLEQFIGELEKADLTEKKTVAEIPTFIRGFLDNFTSNFSIANPGEDWQVGCVRTDVKIQHKVYDKETGDSLIQFISGNSQPLPSRQLIYFGIGKDIALMSYYIGGIGK